AEGAEGAPQPARRGAHSVHPLRVALPRRRVVLAQALEALRERLAEDLQGAGGLLVAELAAARWPIQLNCGGTVLLTVVGHRDHRSTPMAQGHRFGRSLRSSTLAKTRNGRKARPTAPEVPGRARTARSRRFESTINPRATPEIACAGGDPAARWRPQRAEA